MSTTESEQAKAPVKEPETPVERRARLRRVLAELDAAGYSAFLDLCEMLVMEANRTVHGMMKWNHPRVLVHIKHPPRAKKVATR